MKHIWVTFMKHTNNGGRQIGNLPGILHYLGNIPPKTNALFFIHRLISHCNITTDTVGLCNSVARRQVSAVLQTVLLRWCMILMPFESLLFVRQGGLASAVSCLYSINNVLIVYHHSCYFLLNPLCTDHDTWLVFAVPWWALWANIQGKQNIQSVLFVFKKKGKAISACVCFSCRGSCWVPLNINYRKELRWRKARM